MFKLCILINSTEKKIISREIILNKENCRFYWNPLSYERKRHIKCLFTAQKRHIFLTLTKNTL